MRSKDQDFGKIPYLVQFSIRLVTYAKYFFLTIRASNTYESLSEAIFSRKVNLDGPGARKEIRPSLRVDRAVEHLTSESHALTVW